MTKYYVKWEMNPNIHVEDPEARAKGWLQMLGMVKENLAAGKILDWGICCDGSGGYTIMEAPSEEELFAENLKWIPYVNFDARPVLDVDQAIKTIMKAASG